MADFVDPQGSTSTAATAKTEPAVIAAISSGRDRPIAGEPELWRGSARHRLSLLAAGAALIAVAGVAGWLLRRA